MTTSLTTEDSAVVTVKVTGEVAEIEKYRFDYKLNTDTTWKTAATRVSNYRTYGYTYNDLEQGKEYNLRVTATDAEGEIYTSEVQTVNAIYNDEYDVEINITDSKLAGKTVDYGLYNNNCVVRKEISGYSQDQELDLQDKGWKIGGQDEENLYLSVTKAFNLKLYGDVGYSGVSER